jgi:small subunit ribosomal protein S3
MIERTFVKQAIRKLEMENFLKTELGRAGFTKANIVKTPMVTRIIINVVNPGLAIGKSGQNIKSLTDAIEKRFGIDNPQLEIKQIENPALDAQAQADKMKSMLERGFSWRSITYKTVKEVMGSGAQGVELILSGKLAGKGGRKKKQRVAEGYMKKVGAQTELVDFGKASAYPKAGAIGIKIRIVRPGVIFPDKVNFGELMKERIEAEMPAEEVTEKVEEKAEEKVEEKKEEKKEVKKEEKKEVKKEEKKEAPKAEKKEVKKEVPKEAPKEEKKEEKKVEVKKEEKKPEVKEEKKEEKPAEKKEEAKEEKAEEKK